MDSYLQSLAGFLPSASQAGARLASAATSASGSSYRPTAPESDGGSGSGGERDSLVSACFLPPGSLSALAADPDNFKGEEETAAGSNSLSQRRKRAGVVVGRRAPVARDGLLVGVTSHGAVQLWRVQRNPEAQSSEAEIGLVKLASIRTGFRIRAAVVLPKPEKRPGLKPEVEAHAAKIQSNAPLVALLAAPPSVARESGESGESSESADEGNDRAPESFESFRVRLFSLKTRKQCGDLKFKATVRGVYASARVVVIASGKQLLVFDAYSLTKLFAVPAHESRLGTGRPTLSPGTATAEGLPVHSAESYKVSPTVALSQRWLAYEGTDEMPPLDAAPLSAERVVEATKDAVASTASSLYSTGAKLWSDYWGAPESAPAPQIPADGEPTQSPFDARGTVVVVDVVSQRKIAQFRAHSQALACLAWDPSGTVLVTADISGRHLHVYQVAPDAGAVDAESLTASGRRVQALGRVRHMYTLQRGMTDASILNVSVSPDLRWVAASSSHGTTHVFPILGTGGPVGARSHVPEQTPSNVITRVKPFTPIAGEPLVMVAATRLQQPAMARLRALLGQTQTTGLQLSSATVFVGVKGKQSLLLVTQLGWLTKYLLNPHAAVESTGGQTQASVLGLGTVAEWEWDVCRRVNWEDVPLFVDENGEQPASEQLHWKSQAEVSTHSIRPKFPLRLSAVQPTDHEASELHAERRRSLCFEKLAVRRFPVGDHSAAGNSDASRKIAALATPTPAAEKIAERTASGAEQSNSSSPDRTELVSSDPPLSMYSPAGSTLDPDDPSGAGETSTLPEPSGTYSPDHRAQLESSDPPSSMFTPRTSQDRPATLGDVLGDVLDDGDMVRTDSDFDVSHALSETNAPLDSEAEDSDEGSPGPPSSMFSPSAILAGSDSDDDRVGMATSDPPATMFG
jgi:BCAS3, WD40 repeat